MNEQELKLQFWKAFRSGTIKNNHEQIFPSPAEGLDLYVLEEACFRAFDLVIAAVNRSQVHNVTTADDYSLFSRTSVFYSVALAKKCKIENIQFFPIEVKSDRDVLDDRLARQITGALYTFGNSTLVLDKEHSKRIIKSGMSRILPSRIVTCLDENQFEIISNPKIDLAGGLFGFDKKALARILYENNRQISVSKLSTRLDLLQAILEKIAYSQFCKSTDTLDQTEIDFLEDLTLCTRFDVRRKVKDLKKRNSNMRLTDFL